MTAKDFEGEKQYILVEFPYPSGSGLHVGHAFSFTSADVYARYQRMQGKNVLFPMGWDAFGLPTENYAIKTGIKPQIATEQNTSAFKKQMKELALSFDWDREIDTTDPLYYKWTQWIFIKLFEKGLAYKQEMPINWCPKDKIGLANEEVIDGKCERCGTPVVKKNISQWVVKITAYADRLIEGLSKTRFIEKVKQAQINWIGKKEGVRVKFTLEGDSFFKDEPLEIFTTRLDTIYGVTFVVVSPEGVKSWLDRGWRAPEDVVEYVKTSLDKAEQLRLETEKEKTGLNTGLYSINPINQERIAVYVADYVLGSVGTGAVMGVPAHDQRDFEFAEKHGLSINFVVAEKTGEGVVSSGEVFSEDGYLISSGRYNDLTSADARKEIFIDLEPKKLVKKEVTYHLRDWIFSRQHYWGEPIPMIFCDKDGWVSVPEDQLPVVLPDVEKYQPTDTGESPLANITEFVETTCPKCGEKARRETDTMPNWAGSDWYFLRFIDPTNNNRIADMDKMKFWLPVDVYIGGDEHNTLHLLYSRFIYQFLWDLGVVPSEYP
ncbi:leucine--tRNA ligase, partial [Candidatus Collierbacteria bacterium]|nr:leucine--tRNA ligase [Candidatus Collierbacteria bacterium]